MNDSLTPASAVSNQLPGTHAWPAITDIRAPEPVIPPFPVDLIPEPLREWIVDSTERLGVPPEVMWAPAIAAFGSLIGRTRRIYPKAVDDGWYEEPTFWSLLIAPPTTKKTQAQKRAVRPLLELEDEIANEYHTKLSTFEAQRRVLDIQIKAVEGKVKTAASNSDTVKLTEAQSDLEGLLREREAIPSSPPRLSVTDATIEKMQVMLAENPKGLILVRDEFDGQLQTMTTVGHENDRAFLLEGYNTDAHYSVDRMSRESIRIAPSISITGTIQPDTVAPLIKSAIKTGGGDGFLTRFQLPVLYGLDDVVEGHDRQANAAAQERAMAVARRLLEGAQAHMAHPDKPDPPTVRFAPDAQEHADKWRASLQARAKDSSIRKHPAFMSHLGKTEAFGMRLALLFHVIDEVGGNKSSVVTLEQAQAATATADYYLRHAEVMYEVIQDIALKDAEYLLGRFRKGTLTSGQNVTDYQRSTKRSANDLDAAFQLLERHGYVYIHETANAGARSTRTVYINPAIHTSSAPAKEGQLPS